MRERAAKDVSRMLDKPGLKHVVELAEQAQADLDAHETPNTAGTWPGDDTKCPGHGTEQRNPGGGLPAQSERYQQPHGE
ncbi:MAG: hypothetical protein JWO79_1329 [Actinomycetia bacterium]|nr:hypothetical protein [Actinomycetes bacterium]